MDDCKMEESHLDRLSELPQSLILHILSFLKMRHVVSTTLLSKRWENLWTMIPCLNFTDITTEFDVPDSHSLRNFVNRALIFWKGAKLLKLVIDMGDDYEKSLAGDIDLWVRFAVQNRVEELNISLAYEVEAMEWEEAVMRSKKDVYWAPQCLNSCSTIRKLSLVGCNLRIQGFPAWNHLTSLKIDGFCFGERLINRILLGAPQLEVFELRLIESNENLNIRSTSLKKLKIEKYLYFDYEQPSLGTVLRICCPNVETLEISGVLYGECLLTNVSSLMDATLDIDYSKWYRPYGARGIELLGETMRSMFSTFQHVERLALSLSLKVLRASLKENLFSPLSNVVVLEFGVCSIEPVEMVHLLESFPNLKMLVIEDYTPRFPTNSNAENSLEFGTNLSKSFLLQVKIVEITSDFHDSSIFRCIEFLLKHGIMLEELVIRRRWKCSEELVLDVAERLQAMPRSSPNAKVIFNKKLSIVKTCFAITHHPILGNGLAFGNVLHMFDCGPCKL